VQKKEPKKSTPRAPTEILFGAHASAPGYGLRCSTKTDPIETKIVFLPFKKIKKKKRLQWKAGPEVILSENLLLQKFKI